MKWDKLKAYIEGSLQHGNSIERLSDQEKGFLYGFEDILDKMRNLEGEEETRYSNRYWIPEEDANRVGTYNTVTIGKEYEIVWDDRDEEEVIIDDEGSMSLDFMMYNGRYTEK